MIAANPTSPGTRSVADFTRVLFGVCALLFGALVIASSAHARSLEAKEKTALGTTIVDFTKAIDDLNFETVVGYMPPPLLEVIAKGANLTVEKLRPAIVAQSRKALAVVKIETFTMALDKAVYKALPSGEPYVLIPTHTIIAIQGKKIIQNEQTVALLDNGKWYLLRVSNLQQLLLLRKAYPAFNDVTIPTGTVQVIDIKDADKAKDEKDAKGAKNTEGAKTPAETKNTDAKQ